jgi:hypothetical protein
MDEMTESQAIQLDLDVGNSHQHTSSTFTLTTTTSVTTAEVGSASVVTSTDQVATGVHTNNLSNHPVAPIIDLWDRISRQLPQSMAIRDAGGDGHCLYYTLAHWLFNNRALAADLRVIVAHFLSNRDNYLRYVHPIIYNSDTGVDFDEDDAWNQFLRSRVPSNPTAEQYFHVTSTTAIHGQMEEVVAVSQLFAVPITVYNGWDFPMTFRPSSSSPLVLTHGPPQYMSYLSMPNVSSNCCNCECIWSLSLHSFYIS